MVLDIKSDLRRYKEIIRKKTVKNLRNYIGSPQIIDLESDEVVYITLSDMGIPSFQHAINDGIDSLILGGGVINPYDSVKERLIDEKKRVGITINELLDLMVENLKLPVINPPKKEITIVPEKGYEGMAVKGPEARRNFKQTFKRALKRQIATGGYDSGSPIYVKGHDKRYNIPQTKKIVSKKAVVINIRDACMQKNGDEIDRILTFNHWAKLWLKRNYDQVRSEYIVHSNRAFVVDRRSYERAELGGGSKFSPAYVKCLKLIDYRYPGDKWNVYINHFTGNDLQRGDENETLFFLKHKILPKVNSFGFGKIKDEKGIEILFDIAFKQKNIRVFNLTNRSEVYLAIGKYFESGM